MNHVICTFIVWFQKRNRHLNSTLKETLQSIKIFLTVCYVLGPIKFWVLLTTGLSCISAGVNRLQADVLLVMKLTKKSSISIKQMRGTRHTNNETTGRVAKNNKHLYSPSRRARRLFELVLFYPFSRAEHYDLRSVSLKMWWVFGKCKGMTIWKEKS